MNGSKLASTSARQNVEDANNLVGSNSQLGKYLKDRKMMELSQPIRLSESYERLSKPGPTGKRHLEIERTAENIDDYGAPIVNNVAQNAVKID